MELARLVLNRSDIYIIISPAFLYKNIYYLKGEQLEITTTEFNNLIGIYGYTFLAKNLKRLE